MKLLHLGDLHIGKTVSDFNMIEDQAYVLDRVLDVIREREIDGILLAGDIYDRPIPSEEAVRLLDRFLCGLSAAQTEVFIISGNHDSDERLHFGSSLFEKNHIHICARYDGVLYKRECQDAHGRLNVYLLPFVKASQVKHFFPEEKIETYEDAVKTVIAHARIDTAERNVLVAHQFVAGGGADPVPSGSESMATLNVGTIERIGAECFDAFDYVALGHIHSPQRVGRETVRYAGSPLKYSLSEVHNEKSMPLVTFGEKGDVSVELIPIRPLRDMRHLKGKLSQLLEGKNIVSPEDYIYVTLTDETPVNDAMGIFQRYYKNTMKIMYDNVHTREVERMEPAGSVQEKGWGELVTDFYRMMYGCDISEEELGLMEEIAREAGVIDEAG